MAHSREVRVAKVLIIVVIVVAGFGSSVWQLWNWLMPTIFGLPVITFWQALGLLGLSWILFGGMRGFGGPHGRCGGRDLRHMSPEERERFRAGFRSRWCHHEEPDVKAASTPAEEPPPYRDFA